MTVAELIEWLQKQDQNAEMVIHDADSGLFLTLEVGGVFHAQQPVDTVAVYGEYETD